jgi:uncharacterized membrane-anchored protein
MRPRLRTLFFGLVALQLLSILGFAAYQEVILRTGQEVLLQTVPVDPRDLFRGDFVILRYKISTLSSQDLCCIQGLERGDTVYVRLLEAKSGDSWEAVAAARQPDPDWPTYIRGKVTRSSSTSTGLTLSVEYGLESYFVPEGQGMSIERAGDVKARVAVDDRGAAVIKELIVDGQPWQPGVKLSGPRERDAANTELQNVQSGVFNMMRDNRLVSLPKPVTSPTHDMSAFPDTTAPEARGRDKGGNAFALGDGVGWVLFGMDVSANGANATSDQVNYMAAQTTRCAYTVDASGTVALTGGPLGCVPEGPPRRIGTDADAELQLVQRAVSAVRVDNGLGSLPNPVTFPTNDMSAFPDNTTPEARGTDRNGIAFAQGNGAGWVLVGADVIANGANAASDQVTYLAMRTTRCSYTVDAGGTVTRAQGPGC